MQQRPNPGEIYRHFKNKLYQVIAIARHSETGEEMVVYQALYGTFETYVRPLSMFVSEVDRAKYPTAAQKYRFEKIDRGTLKEPEYRTQEIPEAVSQRADVKRAEVQKENIQKESVQKAERMPEEIRRTERMECVKTEEVNETQKTGAPAEESGVNPNLLAFLETDTYEEKYKLLQMMHNDMTDRLINDLAVALDITVDDGPVDKRYEQLRSALATLCRYEVNRFR